MGTPVIFVDSDLAKKSERARIEEFLPLFNLVTVRPDGSYVTSFDPATPLCELRNPGDAWREKAEKLAALGYSELYDLGGLGGWPYGLE